MVTRMTAEKLQGTKVKSDIRDAYLDGSVAGGGNNDVNGSGDDWCADFSGDVDNNSVEGKGQ